MSKSWTKLAVMAAASLWAGAASAQLINLGNTATRAVLVQTEDTACFNTDGPGVLPPAFSPADLGCWVYGQDFSDTTGELGGTEDFFGVLSHLGGTRWIITIPQPVWELAVNATLAVSGVNPGTATANQVVFDSASGAAAPVQNADCAGAGNPAACCTGAGAGTCAGVNYWTGTTSFGLTNEQCTASGIPGACCTGAGTGTCDPLALNLSGTAEANDRPYFGTAKTPYPNADCTAAGAPYACCTGAGTGTCTGTTVPGIPLELSCANKLAASAYGPGNPGPSICPTQNSECTGNQAPAACCTGVGTGTCALLPAQPGWATGPSTLAAFTATQIEVLPGFNATTPTATPLDWRLLETLDTDGDLTPNDFDTDDDDDGVLDLGNSQCTAPGLAGLTVAACCTGSGTGTCAADNCPWTANAAQTDSGGVNTAVADGIGDACQCGDTNNSGIVTATDATVLSRAILGLSPYFSVASGLGGGGPGLRKCNVAATVTPGVAGCTATDATVISRATVSLPPGIQQGCDAANP